MRVVKTLVGLLLVLVLVVVIVGVGSLAYLTARALPQTSGNLQVAGLQSAVTVVRDRTGIAHITADSTHDLFLAQGYVHAQERMWQMEVWRHISSGRLSELFGASQVDTDSFIRTLGWRQAAENDLEQVSPEARAILDDYAAGVNAWLDANRGKLPLAYLVTGATPEPWTALDTLTWTKVQAWNLGGNLDSELFRYLADARLGDPAKTDQLFPAYRADAPVITPSGLSGSGGAGSSASPVSTGDSASAGSSGPTAGTGASAASAGRGTPLPADAAAAWTSVASLGDSVMAMAGLDAASGLGSDHGIGSNDWVVAPSQSTTGGALLANDPHLGISMPSIWFINGLHCRTVSATCPYDVAGVSFPGVPGVVLGHNARIAWGATNVDPDVQDLVIEQPDPADPTHYLTGAGSLPFDVRTEEIKVKGGDPVTLQVRSTRHGPILNGVDDRLAGAPLMALRWTATQSTDRTFEAIMGLNVAANFDDFRAALSLYGAPAQNFVYADVDGHIGYQFPGYVPVRSNKADKGDRPVAGDKGEHEWLGRIPFDDLPWQYDPAPGRIVTANNAAVDANYPYFVAQEWDPGDRAQRISDLLDTYGKDGVSVADIGRIQTDTVPLRAAIIQSKIRTVIPSTEAGQTIANRIRTWDGTCDTASLGCAAFSAFEYRVYRDIWDDELGPLARDYVGSSFSWIAFEGLLDDEYSPWWDDTTTPNVTETRDVIVARAMDEAGAELHDALGSDTRWSWGALHTATFKEGTLGESGIGPLEWYYNDGPHEVSGIAGAVNNTYYRFSQAYPDPTDPTFQPVGIGDVFDMTNMPSYRLAIDMSDLDGARIIITTGQAGNPFDAHYNDQIRPWIEGGTVALPFTASAIQAAAAATLTLTP